jgi:hypothetical protein
MKATALVVIAFLLAPRVHGPQKRAMVPETGSVAVHWTIGGASDSGACARFHASAVDVSVADESDTVVARVVPRCAAFSTVLALPQGSYRGFAALLDEKGNIVSLGPTVRFSVTSGRDASVSFDFPPMG